MGVLSATHGLDTGAVVVVATSLLLWALASSQLGRANITLAMAFVGMGLVLVGGPIHITHLDIHSEVVKSAAELTLAVVLFTDAAGVNVRRLLAETTMPVRLLAIGLPLSVAAGLLAARLLYSGVGIWACVCMAASVAPTDAALGAPIMEDERLPRGLRRALNIESGLNDGIATPIVNFSIVGAVAAAVGGTGLWEGHALRELAYGLLFGLALGLVGGWLLIWSERHCWSASMSRPVVPLALAFVAYAGAVQLHGNGFVASFVAGLAFAATGREDPERRLELSVTTGELMSAVVWFLVGATLIPTLDGVTWRAVVFALIALTLVRMVPVAISLIGTGTDRATVALMGWFGPRGLASVVFAILALDALPKPEGNTVFTAVSLTVLVSVVAHGLSAAPLATLYVLARSPMPGQRPTGESG